MKIALRESATRPSSNPFFDANSFRNDVSARTLNMNFALFALAFVLACAVCALTGLLLRRSSEPAFRPYVVTQCGGEIKGALAAAPMDETESETMKKLKISFLIDFVGFLRKVTLDARLQRDWIAAAMIRCQPDAPAFEKTRHHFLDSNVLERASRELVDLEFETVLQQSPDTWQVQWKETVHDHSGTVTGELRMRGLVTIIPMSGAMPEKLLSQNVLGIFVRDWDIQQRM